MEPRLRLERAIGVPDAIVSPANRTLIAGRLLHQRVEISFDSEQTRQSHGWSVDRAIEVLTTRTITAVAESYERGDLDLLLWGYPDTGAVERLVGNEFQGVREGMMGQGMVLGWARSDDMALLVESAVAALQSWMTAHPLDLSDAGEAGA